MPPPYNIAHSQTHQRRAHAQTQQQTNDEERQPLAEINPQLDRPARIRRRKSSGLKKPLTITTHVSPSKPSATDTDSHSRIKAMLISGGAPAFQSPERKKITHGTATSPHGISYPKPGGANAGDCQHSRIMTIKYDGSYHYFFAENLASIHLPSAESRVCWSTISNLTHHKLYKNRGNTLIQRKETRTEITITIDSFQTKRQHANQEYQMWTATGKKEANKRHLAAAHLAQRGVKFSGEDGFLISKERKLGELGFKIFWCHLVADTIGGSNQPNNLRAGTDAVNKVEKVITAGLRKAMQEMAPVFKLNKDTIGSFELRITSQHMPVYLASKEHIGYLPHVDIKQVYHYQYVSADNSYKSQPLEFILDPLDPNEISSEKLQKYCEIMFKRIIKREPLHDLKQKLINIQGYITTTEEAQEAASQPIQAHPRNLSQLFAATVTADEDSGLGESLGNPSSDDGILPSVTNCTP